MRKAQAIGIEAAKLTRGDIVIAALSGDLGKPRPAVIVETDRLAPTDHVLLCAGTTHVREDVGPRRISVAPDAGNGLRKATQFQIDKLTVLRRSKCAKVIGHLGDLEMDQLNEALIMVLGLAD